MKVAVIYYSFTGNTKKVSEQLSQYLKEKGDEVDLFQLRPEEETKQFLKQAFDALLAKEVKLVPDAPSDLSGYEVIFLGSPVWAFSPAPALRSYIPKLKGCEGKKFYLFVTYGSGVGRFRCLDIMASLVGKVGGHVKGKIAISERKVGDGDYLRELFSAWR